jgi:hypothetical protein
MMSVFAGFVLTEDPTIKSIGFALAVGVFLDAFIVRMSLVPAVMSFPRQHRLVASPLARPARPPGRRGGRVAARGASPRIRRQMTSGSGRRTETTTIPFSSPRDDDDLRNTRELAEQITALRAHGSRRLQRHRSCVLAAARHVPQAVRMRRTESSAVTQWFRSSR